MEKNLFICDCGDIEHQMIILNDPTEKEKEIYVEIHLSDSKKFFQRLWIGIKYIFGKKSKYGNWDEIILNEENMIKLKNIIEGELNKQNE